MEYPCLLQTRNFGMDCSMDNEQAQQNKRYGGESGIRTHVTLSSKHAFQACAFSHSAISPVRIHRLRNEFVGNLPEAKNNSLMQLVVLISILWMVSYNGNLPARRRRSLRRA